MISSDSEPLCLYFLSVPTALLSAIALFTAFTITLHPSLSSAAALRSFADRGSKAFVGIPRFGSLSGFARKSARMSFDTPIPQTHSPKVVVPNAGKEDSFEERSESAAQTQRLKAAL